MRGVPQKSRALSKKRGNEKTWQKKDATGKEKNFVRMQETHIYKRSTTNRKSQSK